MNLKERIKMEELEESIFFSPERTFYLTDDNSKEEANEASSDQKESSN